MKHPFSFALVGILLVLCGVLVGVVLLQSHVISVPLDWTTSHDDGSGVVDRDDGAANDDVVTTPIVSDSGNVVISMPASGEMIGLPLVIQGKARVFESTLNYRLLDADGTVLVEGYVMANAPDVGQFGDYVVTTSYPQPTGDHGTVEVFDYSAKDGSVIDLARVPVFFSDIASMTVKAFWTTQDSANDCSVVVATDHRVVKNAAVAHEALSQLLAGPDTTDVAHGYGTSIPQFALLKSITIEDGVATAEFSSAIETGGSCRVASIRAQIEATLRQFPTVTSVVIRSEGKTATESLQP